MRWPSRGLLVVVVAASVVVATFSWYLSVRTSAAEVSVELPVRDVDGIGAGSRLVVKVSNVGATRIEPVFWVMWSVWVRIWDRVDGPGTLDPGVSQLYTIHSPYAQMSVPNGTPFVVKVFDPASGLYFRSDASRLVLVDSPPIRNPALRFWDRDVTTGAFQPFAWAATSRLGPGDDASIGPANGSEGLRIQLLKSAVGTDSSYGRVVQAIPPGDVMRLRSFALDLCWKQAIDYTSDPATRYPLAASGLGFASSTRLAWVVLSSTVATVVDLPDHTIVVVRAAVSQPGCIRLPTEQLIDSLGATESEALSLLLFAWVSPRVPGDYVYAVTSLSLG